MGLLEDLMGSSKDREEYQGYVDRYEKGPAWEGYSDQEVLDRYDSVAHKVSPQEYEQAARDSYNRLSPEERAEFSRYLEERARSRHIQIPDRKIGPEEDMGDVDWLSQITGQIHQQPGTLRDMLGPETKESGPQAPGLGGLFTSPLAKAALAGIGALLFKRLLAPK